MKRVLITGANSYIGTSFENYLRENYPNDYVVDTVDMIDGSWRNMSFAGYDSVFHVAGIAHQKETKKNIHLYYEVNRDVAIETAQKSKRDSVKQFIFLSSMSVYGMEEGVITKDTQPNPKSHYGKSKWEAEQAIVALQDENFIVCVLRPPMVYGRGCKGNFQTILKIVKKSPLFPKVRNERSMIYIDNLNSFVNMCIEKNIRGVHCPQNKDYICTMNMAQNIAFAMNKRLYFDCVTGAVVSLLRLFYPTAKKAFGNLVYKDTENFNFCYSVSSNEESFRNSVD